MVVGYDPSTKEKIPWTVYSLSGAASGFVTRALTQPLDVVKIRLQVQDNQSNCNGSVKYKGMLQTIRKIVAEEGKTALWKGHVPAQFLSISYGLIQFSCFEMLTRLTYSPGTSEFVQPLVQFACGGLSGLTAIFVSYPFDVVRTRFVIQGQPKVYSSVYQAFKIIPVKESTRGLYKGFVPTIVQIVPHTGFQFAFYNLSSSAWDVLGKKINPDRSDVKPPASGVIKTLACGSLAGLGAKIAVYPLDFAKKRLQMEGFHSYGNSVIGKCHSYKGLMDCLATVVRNEGFFALYKGLAPSIFKAVSSTALIFCSYEQFFRVFSSLHHTVGDS